MQNIYLATIFAGAMACFLTSLLLFVRRRSGERSRVILACIILFSVFNYISRFVFLCRGEKPKLVISAPMLLLAIFMEICYIMYPVEVISPGYLNFRRIIRLFSPWMLLVSIFIISLSFGVSFPPYHSVIDMIPAINNYHVWFRLVLMLFVFFPVLLIFTVKYTKHYNNTDKTWIRKYVLCFTVNTLAYMILLVSDVLVIKILYYYISVGCSIYIAYMELFERLIDPHQLPEPISQTAIADKSLFHQNHSVKTNPMCEKVLSYMERTSDYKKPDISLNILAASLCSNRTTLSNALRDLGYVNFNAYINALRIEEFIRIVHTSKSANYQDAFFEVGFRSRSTAFRNFKQYTGKTSSEYFDPV